LDINKRSGSPSVISIHRLELNHEINWNEIKILDCEPSYNKRLVSEMIYIKKQQQLALSKGNTKPR